jgi:hypothetical protein
MKVRTETSGFAALACLGAAMLAGCSDRPSAVELPSVDASDVAAYAMEHYDTDQDGAINAAEMAANCPPLATALASYDADNNGQLSAQEIEERTDRLYGASAAHISVECTVTWSGRPLRGATVKFRPVEMLESSIKPAQGVTNDSGVARIAMPTDQLPDDLKDVPLMLPGLYYVEITHPSASVPARYNTETRLGFEVDPAQERTGTSAWFDLKPK